jgi:hypothetical protein
MAVSPAGVELIQDHPSKTVGQKPARKQTKYKLKYKYKYISMTFLINGLAV